MPSASKKELLSLKHVPGCPKGDAKKIEELSLPPLYTACPNPWLADFFADARVPAPAESYVRQPFVVDVEENKHHFIYNAHSYHTKTPHRAVMRYILHYTLPGDTVLDTFSGTGVTGIAASLCGDPDEVRQLGYSVLQNNTIRDAEGREFSKVGIRRAALIDLSPAATFIARSHNTSSDSDVSEKWDKVWAGIKKEYARYYCTLHKPTAAILTQETTKLKKGLAEFTPPSCAGEINYVVWSDMFSCSECGHEFVYWNVAVDVDNGKVRDTFNCPACKVQLTKRSSQRVYQTYFDEIINKTVRIPKQDVVLINYTFSGTRYEKLPDNFDRQILATIEKAKQPFGIPTAPIPEGDKTPEALRLGYTHAHHFFTKRNLAVFSAFRNKLPADLLWVVTGALLRGSKQHQIAISRVGGEKEGEGGATAGHRRGTLYIPSNQVEMNALTLVEDRYNQTSRAKRIIPKKAEVIISTQSACALPQIPNESVDYIFLDPPFGSNIMYSELSFIWEAFLGVFTANEQEAIENRTQNKNLDAYRGLIKSAFSEAFRVLRPGRWITIEFSNTSAAVWNAIQAALNETGFVIASVSFLNKGRGGLNAIVGQVAVKQDLVINAYKPTDAFEKKFSERGSTEDGVWDFIRTHLKYLPVVKAKGGQLETIAERDPRIIYDRMVAFYMSHSTPVPLSSAEFQAGLADKFPERDGMFFLPEQVNEYDKKRAQVENVGQLSIFVEDERSAINWLRSFLKTRPSVSQDIQPEFMQQLGASWKKWEARPEMSALLDQNFLCYDGISDVPSQIHGYLSTQFKELRNLAKDAAQLKVKAKNRWYVPDPKKNVDVETLRNKRLLEEFWSYLPEGYTPPALSTNKGQALPGLAVPRPKIPKGKKLKELRTEAVRVGFKHCYQQKDYMTILVVAEMIPESVLNEDEQLQMIYDAAVTRTGEGS